MDVIFNIERKPAMQDVIEIQNKIRKFNVEKAGPLSFSPLAIFARDISGNIVGGVIGYTLYQSVFIDILWVDSERRGQGIGKKLMQIAEDFAKEENITLIYLDTFSFQAPLFYQKLGYQVFGELEFHNGMKRFFLKKDL